MMIIWTVMSTRIPARIENELYDFTIPLDLENYGTCNGANTVEYDGSSESKDEN